MPEAQNMTSVWRGSTRAERIAERRAALLKSAIEIVGEHGASAMTTKAVCERAGLAERSIYESFGSRDALLLEVWDTCAARATERLAAAFYESHGAARVVQIRHVLSAAADLAVDDPGMIRIVFIESVNDPVLHDRMQTGQSMLETLFTQLAGDVLADAAPGIATFIVAGLIGSFTAWVSGRLAMSKEDVIDSGLHAIVTLTGLDQPAR